MAKKKKVAKVATATCCVLDPLKVGKAIGLLSALCMLVLSILASLGAYTGAAAQMAKCHMFYSLTIVGTITGIIEAAVIGFIAGYVFVLIYNKV